MSLQYLLDGYNIIHQIPSLTLKAIDVQRAGLIRLIEKSRPQGSRRNDLTVVFDGRPGRSRPPESAFVQVIFSMDKSADDRIKSMVREAKNNKNIIVVTDDRDIQYAVRAMGSRVLAVSDFIARMRKGSAQSPASKNDESKVTEHKAIAKDLEERITSEFEDIWLKKKID